MPNAPFHVSVREHGDGRSFLYVVQQDPALRTDLRNGTMVLEIKPEADPEKLRLLAADLSDMLRDVALPF